MEEEQHRKRGDKDSLNQDSNSMNGDDSPSMKNERHPGSGDTGTMVDSDCESIIVQDNHTLLANNKAASSGNKSFGHNRDHQHHTDETEEDADICSHSDSEELCDDDIRRSLPQPLTKPLSGSILNIIGKSCSSDQTKAENMNVHYSKLIHGAHHKDGKRSVFSDEDDDQSGISGGQLPSSTMSSNNSKSHKRTARERLRSKSRSRSRSNSRNCKSAESQSSGGSLSSLSHSHNSLAVGSTVFPTE